MVLRRSPLTSAMPSLTLRISFTQNDREAATQIHARPSARLDLQTTNYNQQ